VEQSVARCGLRDTMGDAPRAAPAPAIEATTPACCSTRRSGTGPRPPALRARDRLPSRRSGPVHRLGWPGRSPSLGRHPGSKVAPVRRFSPV
jgi:hypothetical protein